MSGQSYNQGDDLAQYFTDVEIVREKFRQEVIAPTLPKHILDIHGVGGIGKSSLLRMFRLTCKTLHVGVGLASGDEAKSVVEVLASQSESGAERGWVPDLKVDGVPFTTFDATFAQYRAVQAKVEDQAKSARDKTVEVASKAASKTAEAASGAAMGAIIGSIIPGIGTTVGAVLGGVIGGMGAEVLTDWLRGFLSKPEIDLLLDPSKKLTEDFLNDVNKFAEQRRVVLMLDTFEQMTTLDDWARDVAQHLHQNVLLVISGRKMVNWGRKWDSWLSQADVEELKPMTKRVMRELIYKYYATMHRGEPNPKQVNTIIEFARGLPIVVNTAVQLWVQYGMEDFGAVKGEVVREVVARLREGVPAELYPLLEVAAAMRYFNKDILRTVAGMGDISTGYEELLRFPFVRPRAEGYALHDRVREMIEENVQMNDPTKYRNVHERAAAYFEARIANATRDGAERFRLERLYHSISADQGSGIKLFQEIAEGFVLFRFNNLLRQLLTDVKSYSERSNSENSRLWVEYYSARLFHLEGHWVEAESIYEKVGTTHLAEPKLRAYALRYWGAFLRNRRQLERSIEVFNESFSLVPVDSTLADGYLDLAVSYRRKGALEKSLSARQAAREFYTRIGDKYGLIATLNSMKTNALWHGNVREGIKYKQLVIEQLSPMSPQPASLWMQFLADWGIFWAWFGRLNETEKELKEALSIAERLDWGDVVGINRDMGYILAMQNKFVEANECFANAHSGLEKTGRDKYTPDLAITLGDEGAALAKQGEIEKAEQILLKSLDLKSNSLSAASEKDQEVCLWLGQLYEVQFQGHRTNIEHLESAQSFYRDALYARSVQRLHFDCYALSGLVRIKHAQSDYAAIPPLLIEAEQLAQQSEYNDHLASLRLTQGHVTWDGHIPEWGKGFDAAFEFYKLALVYALRYNRFLLDEIMSGRPQGTPLRPIIPECLKQGDEGLKMLSAIREWWQTGKNDVGTPRPDTISPILENIPLLEAEKVARERELGDGSTQKTVIEQLDAALA